MAADVPPDWYAIDQEMRLSGVLVPAGITKLGLGEPVDPDAVPDGYIVSDDAPGSSPVLLLDGMTPDHFEFRLNECDRIADGEIDAVASGYISECVDEFLGQVDQPDEEEAGPASDGDVN